VCSAFVHPVRVPFGPTPFSIIWFFYLRAPRFPRDSAVFQVPTIFPCLSLARCVSPRFGSSGLSCSFSPSLLVVPLLLQTVPITHWLRGACVFQGPSVSRTFPFLFGSELRLPPVIFFPRPLLSLTTEFDAGWAASGVSSSRRFLLELPCATPPPPR